MTVQNSKNLRLNGHTILNSKLGITLRVSVTSATKRVSYRDAFCIIH